ncbi:MAG TPA: SDR family oxidoreductase [Cytophagaceae bacterium]
MKKRKKNVWLGVAAGVATLLAAKNIFDKLTEYSLKDKVVLITGGSRGLGLILARKAASEGAKVAICARKQSELDIALKDLSHITKNVLAIPCDLRVRYDIIKMIEKITAQWGPVDVLINNAGIIQVGPEAEMTEMEYDQAMKIHFWAPLHTILEVLPAMKKRRSGRIVNIVSIGGKISFPHLLPYNASKFALAGLSEGLYAELKKYGITVSTIYPGLMRTGSPRNINVKGKNELEYAWFKITDSLPLLSVKAEYAASRILQTVKTGKAHQVISLPAKLAIGFHDLFPERFLDIMAIVNDLLPDADGQGKESVKGYESESKITRSFLTRLTNRAAKRNNEIVEK